MRHSPSTKWAFPVPRKRKNIVKFFAIASALMLSAGFALPQIASAQESFRCAGENEYCNLPGTHDHYATSYGSADRSVIVETENLGTIPCSNDLGDPHRDVGKSCNAIEVRQATSEPKLSFARCASENQKCTVPAADGEYAVVRYGANGKWLYNNVGSDVWCANGYFGFNFDPLPNVAKVCEKSTTMLKGAARGSESRWQTCANEGGDCKPLGGFGTYLIRYGADTRWLYRTVVGNALGCNSSAFGRDPADGTFKHCQYMGLRTVRNVQGQWNRLNACGGCGANTYKITKGVERGKTRESTSHWTQEVKVSVESGFKVAGIGGTANVETTTTFGKSDTVASSFTETAGTEFEIHCDKGALWQLQTTVDEFCRPSSASCSTTAKAEVFQCATVQDQPKTSWPEGDVNTPK